MVKFDEYDFPMVKKFFNELKTDTDLKKTKYLEAQFEISLTEDNLYMGYEVREAGYFGFTLMVIETETIWKNRKRPIYIIVEEGPGYDVPEEFFYGYIGDALDKIKNHYDSFWLDFENFPTWDTLYAHNFQEKLKKELGSYLEIGAEFDITFDDEELATICDFAKKFEDYVEKNNDGKQVEIFVCAHNKLLLSVRHPRSKIAFLAGISVYRTLVEGKKVYIIEEIEENSYGKRATVYKDHHWWIDRAFEDIFFLFDVFFQEESKRIKNSKIAIWGNLDAGR